MAPSAKAGRATPQTNEAASVQLPHVLDDMVQRYYANPTSAQGNADTAGGGATSTDADLDRAAAAV